LTFSRIFERIFTLFLEAVLRTKITAIFFVGIASPRFAGFAMAVVKDRGGFVMTAVKEFGGLARPAAKSSS
jgi:hypothetical protein